MIKVIKVYATLVFGFLFVPFLRTQCPGHTLRCIHCVCSGYASFADDIVAGIFNKLYRHRGW